MMYSANILHRLQPSPGEEEAPQLGRMQSPEEAHRQPALVHKKQQARTAKLSTRRANQVPQPISRLLGCLSLLLLVQQSLSQQQGSQAYLAENGGASSTSVQSVLLDTTEQSALGWTKYPDGGPGTRTPGWVEESFTNFERGINWRSFVVCDVNFNSVNNWLWTPYIERQDANRLYIEIKFTMRDCNLFPQRVLSCKETFALLYKETDEPIEQLQASASNASFAQSDSYSLIDAIAADEGRFTSNTDVVINTEIRSVPVSRRGVYFAFRDQGACLSLISIKVYQLRCPQLTTGLATFNATPTGRDPSSLATVEGQCVANAIQVEPPRMICAADGKWTSMSSGQCKCLAGFEPAANGTRCQPCPAGRFKPFAGELACQACPEHSHAPLAGQTECRCHEGYYRAARDGRAAACTQPPGPPSNLSAVYADPSSLVLQWAAPHFSGGRADVSYRLHCENCDQTMVSSPQFYANFSETKCVLSGLSPATTYRFLVFALNGVSALAGPPHLQQFSEIAATTGRPSSQSGANALSSQAGFQLMPIYNLRALPGARGTDMVLAWDALPLQPDAELAGELAGQLPALYELRFQPRQLADGPARRSPYAALTDPQQVGAQSITTTNRAVAINSLQPRTEYAFQIRTKWAHSSQWTDFSEPIYMSTSSQPAPSASGPSFQAQDYLLEQVQGGLQILQVPSQNQQVQASSSGWFGSAALLLVGALLALALAALSLLQYRKSGGCPMQSLGGFGTLAGSTYGGVYGSAVLGGGPLAGFGGPLAHAHHATLSSGSAGGLITGSNGTSRSSSGGNVVQNLIAATLSQIGARQMEPAKSSHAHHNQTLAGDGKLFAAPASQTHQLPRNHYHQTLAGVNHSVLTAGHLAPTMRPPMDSFKYRALQAGSGNQLAQQDPQLHIYDDLEVACSALQRQQSKELDPDRVTIEMLLSRGDFADTQQYVGRLRTSAAPGLGETETGVSIKTLRPQASDKAKLDFLVEAALLSRFEHPNIVRLEGLVSSSEPPMIVSELMENGPLDAYLRDNKSRFTSLQLISMLRGIASGMLYLAKQNYVHKDLAARNIQVNSQNVCKIADFGLQASQTAAEVGTGASPVGDYSNDSTSSSNTLSSQTTGSTPTTASTVAGGTCGSSLSQLQAAAEQIVQQRFASQPQPALPHLQQQQPQQSAKIPVRWTALEAIAFRRFTSASDVWSFGVVCWEVMTEGERPYWSWTNQQVIKAVEQGYRLPQPDSCPEQLYKLMLDCWLKERVARPTFGQILSALDRLLSPYDDPFSSQVPPLQQQQQQQQMMMIGCAPTQQPQLVSLQTRIQQAQEPAYYDTCNPISQLINGTNNKSASHTLQEQLSVDEWLHSIKMVRYRDNFQRHQINSLQYVARLSLADLNQIGISNGQHVKKILSAIAQLRSASSIGASGEGYLV